MTSDRSAKIGVAVSMASIVFTALFVGYLLVARAARDRQIRAHAEAIQVARNADEETERLRLDRVAARDAEIAARAKTASDAVAYNESYVKSVARVNRFLAPTWERFRVIDSIKMPGDDSWIFLYNGYNFRTGELIWCHSIVLDPALSSPQEYTQGRFFWEKLRGDRLVLYFAEVEWGAGDFQYKVVSSKILKPGSLNATLMTVHDGSLYGMYVRGYSAKMVAQLERFPNPMSETDVIR